MTLLDELKKLVPMPTGPETHMKKYLVLYALNEFEGRGKASEAWDINWVIEFPLINAYWRQFNKLTRCKEGAVMSFKGTGPMEVMHKAITTLTELKAMGENYSMRIIP